MSIKKYSEYIALHERKTRTAGFRSIEDLQETAGSKKKDQLYAADEEHRNYDTHIEHVGYALQHAEEKKYKINHEGYESPHKHPDVTFHYARGDDEPHAYTVHHNGAAARDKELHVRSIHQGDADAVHEQMSSPAGLGSIEEAASGIKVSSDYEDGYGPVNVTIHHADGTKKIKSDHYYNEHPGDEDRYTSKDRNKYHEYLKTKHNLSDHEAKAVSSHFDKMHKD